MKRSKLVNSHLIELRKEIPILTSSREEKLSGGFLSVSSTSNDNVVINNNNVVGCVCNECGTVTPTQTPTATRTIVVILPSGF